MKNWKLYSGILNCVLFPFIFYMANQVSSAYPGSQAGAPGCDIAMMLLIGGIVSICTKSSVKNGGNIAMIILYSFGAFEGITHAPKFSDIYPSLWLWSIWILACAVMAVIAYRKNKQQAE